MRNNPTSRIFFAIALVSAIVAVAGAATRVKDIADVLTGPTVTLQGYGLVIGLEGSGDGSRTVFTQQSLASYLDRLGIRVDPNVVRVKNVAAVMVTAKMVPFSRAGQKYDVVLSSLGDAKSLNGGNLMATPLLGPDGLVYGNAQGPVLTGGYSVESEGQREAVNPSVVGRIVSGLTLTRTPASSVATDSVIFMLKTPDFTSAKKLSDRLRAATSLLSGGFTAYPVDPSTIVMMLPDTLQNPAGWMTAVAAAETLEIETDVTARVVINERTGTVVVGDRVRLLPVAIAHGALSIRVKQTPVVSQPNAFGQGTTAQSNQTELNVSQQNSGLQVFQQSASVGDVANALNKLGVTPRDVVAIFQALKAAGALQADLVII